MSFGLGFSFPNWQPLSGGFNPFSLFVGGVQGVFFDPSDPATLFSDTAGTTPSPTPGGGALSVVGLMLDKSQGLALGSELVTNGTFTSTSGWTAEPGAGVTLSAANNVLTITQTGGTLYGRAYQALSGLTVGQIYQYTAQVASNPGSLNVNIWAHTGFTGTPAAAQYGAGTSSTGNLVVRFQATATTMYVVMWFNTTVAGSVGFANASVKSIAGNHAISYNTTTARPELSARVNLLTYSEQINGGVGTWFNNNSPTVTTNNPDPNGTNTASKIVVNGTTVNQGVYVNVTAIPAGQSGLFSVWLRGEVGGEIVQIGDAGSRQNVTLTTSWQRFSNPSHVLTSTFHVIYAKDNTAMTFYAWGADCRPSNIGTSVPAYQRIADQYTYDSNGFPRYLVFNGTASGMYTPANLNLSGTDKVTVFAGVRKLSDAANQIITELSSIVDTNNGSFSLGALSGSGNYFSALRGTALAYYTETTYTAPISNVHTTSYDIAGAAIAQEIIPRVNGLTPTLAATGANAGTGNFGTYPLYIGSRNNASLWFNGYIYSLLVVGSSLSAAQISSTESWIATKEGIALTPTFVVLPSSGTPSYTVVRTVLSSTGTSYSVSNTVLSSTGTGYSPI